jgi:hypothetical protein
MSISGQYRRTRDAALIPAASPPITTNLSLTMPKTSFPVRKTLPTQNPTGSREILTEKDPVTLPTQRKGIKSAEKIKN